MVAHSHQISFQERVLPWLIECFGPEIASDKLERADRFVEEALELAQTVEGFNAERAIALVAYVFGREAGHAPQEVGGVMVTLAALCLANHMDMHHEAERELARIWTKVEAIRAKQAAKPTGSALPVPVVVELGEEASAFITLQQDASHIAARVIQQGGGAESRDMIEALVREWAQPYLNGGMDTEEVLTACTELATTVETSLVIWKTMVEKRGPKRPNLTVVK